MRSACGLKRLRNGPDARLRWRRCPLRSPHIRPAEYEVHRGMCCADFRDISRTHPRSPCLLREGLQADRVLIIGDPKQVPPAIFSLRNIFSEYGNISLMERLINAGLRPITLVEQYRMYLSISSIINSTSYNGKLSDGSTVRGREHAARFQTFMAQLATRSKTPFNTAISSITISPERRAALHYVPQMMQSQMMQGSTSRYNVQTAVIVLRTIF